MTGKNDAERIACGGAASRRSVLQGMLGGIATGAFGAVHGAHAAALPVQQGYDRDWIAKRLADEKELLIYHPAGSNFRKWLNDSVVPAFKQQIKDVYAVDLNVTLLSTGGGDAAFWQKFQAFKEGNGKPGEFDVDVVRVAPDFQTLDAIRAGYFLPLLPDYAGLAPNVGRAGQVGLETFTHGGKAYAVPFQQPMTAMFYNREKLPQPPRSLDEILAWSIKKPGRFTYEDPRSSAGIGSGTLWLMAVLNGKADIRDRGTWQKGWDYLKELQQSSYAQPNTGEQALELMRRGEIHLMPFWNDWGMFARETLNMPFVANYLLQSGMPIRNTPYAIPADCKHPTAALLYANFALSMDVQSDLAKTMRQIPGSTAREVWERIPEDAFGFKYDYIQAHTFPSFHSRENVDAIRQMAPDWSRAVLGR